jgi:hypothetical protein
MALAIPFVAQHSAVGAKNQQFHLSELFSNVWFWLIRNVVFLNAGMQSP